MLVIHGVSGVGIMKVLGHKVFFACDPGGRQFKLLSLMKPYGFKASPVSGSAESAGKERNIEVGSFMQLAGGLVAEAV